MTPQAELATELERVARQFGSQGGEDMTAFPDFKFEEPLIDSITIQKSN